MAFVKQVGWKTKSMYLFCCFVCLLQFFVEQYTQVLQKILMTLKLANCITICSLPSKINCHFFLDYHTRLFKPSLFSYTFPLFLYMLIPIPSFQVLIPINHYIIISMGNICCEQRPNQPKNRKQIVPSHYAGPYHQSKPRTETEMHLEEQKLLLSDYSYAVMRLKENAEANTHEIYKGFYTHTPITSDQISEYFSATLVDESDYFHTCVVKKIIKERLTSFDLKRAVAIQYMVTSYHSSNFLVRSMFFYEDQTNLNLYFDLKEYIHLNVFLDNPPYAQYFRSNLEINIRFIIAGVILALEELHSLRIVYRGINSSSIIITAKGYPQLTNLSRLHPQGQPSNSISISPFNSPQENRGEPITRASDLWSLGMLIHYLITGGFPNSETFREYQFHPFGISPQLCDLVNRLLLFNPMQRLGVNNITNLKYHPFFNGCDWSSYANQEMLTPFSRTQNSNYPERVEEHYDYQQQQCFDCNYGYGGSGVMAGMLFMELGTLIMISSMFEHDYNNYNQPAFAAQPEVEANNQFQQGCAIQLSEEGSVEEIDGGGDYD